MRKMLRTYGIHLGAIVVIAVIGLGVGGYILGQQGFQFPWLDRYTVQAEFETAQAVTPGQGQPLMVAGVEVGEVSRVELRDGRARVEFEVDPGQLPEVHADARMLLRPRTPLKDMTVQLDPGTDDAPVLDEDDVVPIEQTSPDVDLHEVLASLDTDTRNYLKVLVNAGGQGLEGNGRALRKVLEASAPTLERTERVAGAIAERKDALERLVSNLSTLAGELADHGGELRRLVGASAATFDALAGREAELRESLELLPGTLRGAESALAQLRPFARELGPTLQRLRPTARQLAPVLKDLRPLLDGGAPELADIATLAREAQPLAADVRPAVRDLNDQTPALSRAFDVLQYVVNELAYVPEEPDRGYLFWLAWFAHNVNSMLSVQDANGSFWRGQLIFSCSTLVANEALVPLLTPIYATGACPQTP